MGRCGRDVRADRFAATSFAPWSRDADALKESLRERNQRQGPFFKITDDPRITRVGRLLRRYSLDELPQLWNVLKGEMSLVGPRPHPLDDFSAYAIEHLPRLDVIPGMTGLWQVTARRDPSFQAGMNLDIEYIHRWSLGMDLRILLKTAVVVLRGEWGVRSSVFGEDGVAWSWAGEAAGRGLRMGLRPLQALMMAPGALFLAALAAMLLRPPDVPFYEIDRVAFVLLVLGVAVRAVVRRQRLLVVERATWPMIGLTVLAVASVIEQPFDNQTWCLLAAKFLCRSRCFIWRDWCFGRSGRLRQFEIFALVVLAYLCFTAIAFLVGAKSLIFPRFILDESLGYHADRARGPLLQAVANGVSLNLLGCWRCMRYCAEEYADSKPRCCWCRFRSQFWRR